MANKLDLTNPYQQDIIGLDRQRQLSQMLLQQGMQQPQSQMVSGRYVAPAFTERLANLLSVYAGQRGMEEADKKQLDLAKQLRQQYASEMQNYMDLARGKEQVFEQAGPMPDGGNIPNQMYRTGGDMQMANLYGATAYNPALQQFATKKLLEGPQWKEASKLDAQGNTVSGYVDMNSSNPEATFRPFAMTKTAISPADMIRFRDEGIAIPSQFTGQSQPVGQPTSAYGANVQMTPNQPVARPQGQPMGQPVGQTQAVPMGVPTVGGTAPTVSSEQQKYDYFKAPPVPTGLTGKQARDFVAEQNKPLTGKAADQVTGAVNYQKALDKVQTLLDTYKGPQLLDPNVRAEIKGAIKTAQLQGKEAFGLGVLNGPDLGLLEEIIADPTAFDAFLKDRSTINRLYNNQRMLTSDPIKKN